MNRSAPSSPRLTRPLSDRPRTPRSPTSPSSATPSHPASAAAAAAAFASTGLSPPASPTTKRPKTPRDVRGGLFKRRSHLTEDARRDSALTPAATPAAIPAATPAATPAPAPAPAVLAADPTTNSTAPRPVTPPNGKPTSVPSIIVHGEDGVRTTPQQASPSPVRRTLPTLTKPRMSRPATAPSTSSDAPTFHGLTTTIPSGELADPFSSDELQFSKRGSVLWGGESGMTALQEMKKYGFLSDGNSDTRRLSREEIRQSRRIRSMYAHGTESAANWADENAVDEDARDDMLDPQAARASALSSLVGPEGAAEGSRPTTSASRRDGMIQRDTNEVAGGMEDWQGVGAGETDRYGFISSKALASVHSSSPTRRGSASPDPNSTHRAPNTLQVVEEDPSSPQRGGRPNSRAQSQTTTASGGGPNYRISRRTLRAPPSLLSGHSQASRASKSSSFSRFRSNHSPHNKGRNWMNEASDMLALPPGFSQAQDEQEDARAATLEVKREAKWAKMAKVMSKGPKSGGTEFAFDTHDAKLVERTWKGIPNRWRPTAWYAFLAASAKRRPGSATEAELVQAFQVAQEQNCADDAQIDLDVPRTISGHILFRRRYRGGQRSLFRTLHAIALYFPHTGYVQGMAPLAATLLCYYDEERAFVMLVRLWQLRGLDYLYQEGFKNLMSAFTEFEQRWLAGRVVAKQLADLNISATAYGTKWYLTLFNYSIPFAAQLRVWDVFMLLGDGEVAGSSAGTATTGTATGTATAPNLDVLHATSAALLDGVQEILLDSDFENAMKVLTAPIAIGKADTLMKIAKHEWKEHRRVR